MFDAYAEELRGEQPISSWRRAYRTRESDIVHLLAGATVRWPQVRIGSYPRFMPDGPEVEIVLKSADAKAARRRPSAWLEPEPRHGRGGDAAPSGSDALRVAPVGPAREHGQADRPDGDRRSSRSRSSRLPPSATWLAWTSQYDGSSSAIVVHRRRR